jgi:50S ribosomal subunit-associated GTPase HflX
VLHVADASAGDEALDAMIASVGEVLAEIGAGELPVQLVLNKIDGLDEMRGGGSPTASRTRRRCPPRRGRGSTS